jgi:hypothetical protein
MSHLALAYFSIADPSETSTCQKAGIGPTLANLLLHQWGNFIDIVFVNKTRARIDH